VSSVTKTEAPGKRALLSSLAIVLVVVGIALSLAAFAADQGLRRFAFGYLWGFAFLWTVVLGSLFFVGLHHVTGAVWSVVLRRVAEMLAAPVTLVAVLFLPVAAFAFLPGSGLFPWLDTAAVEGDHVLEAKTAYLNLPFFLVRALVFFGLWFAYARVFVRRSLRQDSDGGSELRSLRTMSTHFMVVFAFTATFAAFDWIKSLDPHWFSTIFGVYVWSGMVVTSLAVMTLATLWLRAEGKLGDVVRPDHLYNLGGLLFAFTCFWGYIAFSQYMLIWYANIPEETIYFAHRLEHGWLPVSLVLGLLRFVLPFLLLLSRRAKTAPRVLIPVSLLVIVGQWLDLYWLIMPQLGAEPVFGIFECGPPLLMTGILLLWMNRFTKRHPMLPKQDPAFTQSCEFHLH